MGACGSGHDHIKDACETLVKKNDEMHEYLKICSQDCRQAGSLMAMQLLLLTHARTSPAMIAGRAMLSLG